jgi:hypothetical protein
MNYGFDEIFAKAQEAIAPFSGMTEMGFDAFEKAVEMQAAILGDALDLAVDELKLLSSATTPAEYLQGQTQIAEQYVARAQKRAQALMASATETQATLASMAEQGVKKAQSAFEQTVAAAQGAPKPAGKKAA